MDHRVFILLLVIWAKVEASNMTARSGWTVLLKVFENCVEKNDSLNCLQQKVLNFANRMTQSKSLELVDGFKFVRDEGIGRSISDSKSNDSRSSLSDQIWNKIGTFFKTHSVEVNIPKFLDRDNEARKKKGNHGLLMVAAAAKGAMIYMGMHAIAALAGKALLVAKVALTIASVIALKKLLEGSGGKTSYEIIKHPQHSYVQTHSSSHEYGGGGGGGGHGGGYEGHYRKRSIAKTKIDGNEGFPPSMEFGEASSDYWKFKLPKEEPGVKFSSTLSNAYESKPGDSRALNERKGFLLAQRTDDYSRREISEHNLSDLNVENKRRQTESGEKKLNNGDDSSQLNYRRSRLITFI